MPEGRSYSIAELQKLSGFDRRTIVYYTQQGLLPRTGRRGPRTRHPHAVLQRLLFIRGLKDLQDQGHCGTITLREMGRMLEQLEPAGLRDLLDRGLPSADIERLLRGPPVAAPAVPPPEPAPPGRAPAAAAPAGPAPVSPTPPAPVRTVGDGRSYGLADAGIRQRLGAPVPPRPASPIAAPAPAPSPLSPAPGAPPPLPPDLPEDLGELLRELEIRPSLGARRVPPGGSELWTEIPVTSRVYLSVRGLAAEDAALADAAGRALKKLLRAADHRG